MTGTFHWSDPVRAGSGSGDCLPFILVQICLCRRRLFPARSRRRVFSVSNAVASGSGRDRNQGVLARSLLRILIGKHAGGISEITRLNGPEFQW
jgi:hypothetical protein